jgi:hypothetical protein
MSSKQPQIIRHMKKKVGKSQLTWKKSKDNKKSKDDTNVGIFFLWQCWD